MSSIDKLNHTCSQPLPEHLKTAPPSRNNDYAWDPVQDLINAGHRVSKAPSLHNRVSRTPLHQMKIEHSCSND